MDNKKKLNENIFIIQSMIALPQILVQEEENMSESCKNQPDILHSVHNYAGKFKNFCRYNAILSCIL
jgi:hypothetical protein